MKFFGNRRWWMASLIALLGVVAGSSSTQAQVTRGFDTTAEPNVTGEELNSQTNLWVFEVSYKPIRMIHVDLTDPKTGRKTREVVWYLCYKAVNRSLEHRQDDTDTTPINEEDPAPTPVFVPEFTLMTEPKTEQKIYQDEILPEAQAAINRRERRSDSDPVFKNSVEIAGAIPPAAPEGATEHEEIYGVAMWRGIDLRTDFFTVFMTGFSNGYREMTGPDGESLFLRRTIVQDFWRPSDEFDPREKEIRLEGDPRWQYRPDEPKRLRTDAAVILPDGTPLKSDADNDESNGEDEFIEPDEPEDDPDDEPVE